jgi:hypothetical protein
MQEHTHNMDFGPVQTVTFELENAKVHRLNRPLCRHTVVGL